jgi:hypothetical protein
MGNQYKQRLLRFLCLIAIAVLALIPGSSAQADMGPKPSMDFEFVFESDPSLSITGGSLLQCLDDACTTTEPLEALGPQGFSCDADHCESMAYGYRESFRLEITFTDGVTRRSNVFGKKHSDALYRVTVRADDLMVEETGGRVNPMLFGIAGALGGSCLVGVFSLGLFAVLFVLVRHAGRGPLSFTAQRGWILAAWGICLPTVALFAYFNLAVPATALLELLLGMAYAAWRKRPRLPLLTGILIANTITQLLLWASLEAVAGGSFWTAMLVGETTIWLIEALIIYLTQRSTMRKREALLVSLGLNAVSFAVGLLMPF